MIFLPDQHAASCVIGVDGDKTQMRATADCQSAVQTKSASQSLLYQQCGIGQEGIAERDLQILFLSL